MRLPIAALAVALTAHAIVGGVSLVRAPQPAGDFDRYYEIASTPGRPYVDYQVEHPIGTVLLFEALAGLPGGRASFGYGIVTINLICDALVVAALSWAWGPAAAACFAISVLPALGLFFNRIDAWSTAAATVAIALSRRQRSWAPGVALGVGAAFKLWPLVLVPLVVFQPPEAASGDSRRPAGIRRPAVIALVLTLAVFGAVTLAVAGRRGIVEVLTFRGAHGWQIESVVGNVLQLAGSRTIRMESGAWRVGETIRPISIAMFLAAAPICLWSTWRGARTGRVGTPWLAAVASLLVLSPLLSAQYVIWLTPATGLAWADGDRRSAVLAAIVVVVTEAFYAMYDLVTAYWTPALLLVLLRNLLLIALAASAIERLGDGFTRPASREKTT